MKYIDVRRSAPLRTRIMQDNEVGLFVYKELDVRFGYERDIRREIRRDKAIGGTMS